MVTRGPNVDAGAVLSAGGAFIGVGGLLFRCADGVPLLCADGAYLFMSF